MRENSFILLIAALLGMVLLFYTLKKNSPHAGWILIFMAVSWGSGLLVGKLMYLLNHWISYHSQYSNFIMWFISATSGNLLSFALFGYASAGGIVGATAGCWVFSKWNKYSFTTLLNHCVLPLYLMYAIVRIGCAVNGCCYGISVPEPDSPFLRALLAHFQSDWLFPVQWLDFFVSMVACLFIFIRTRNAQDDSSRLKLFLLLFPLQRFLLEFLRGDDGRGMVGYVSTTQIFCVILFATGIVLNQTSCFHNKSSHVL